MSNSAALPAVAGGVLQQPPLRIAHEGEAQRLDLAARLDRLPLDQPAVLLGQFLDRRIDDPALHLAEVTEARWRVHRGFEVLDGVFGPAGRLEAHQQFQELPGVARAQGAGLLELVGRELPLQAGEVAQQIRPPRQLDPALAVLVLHRPHPAHLHPRRRQRLAVALVGWLVERDRAVVELLGAPWSWS